MIKFSQGIMNPLAYDFSFIKQNPTCAENVSAKRAKQKNLIGLSPCANSICPGANSIVCRERHLFSLPSSCIIKSLLLQHMAYDHAQVRPHRTELKRCMSVHSELSAAFRTVQCCVEDKKKGLMYMQRPSPTSTARFFKFSSRLLKTELTGREVVPR